MSVPKRKRKVDPNALALVRGKPCWICKRPSDPCHIKTKGSGGDDADWNLMQLCRIHHTEQGTMPIPDFAEKYPVVKFELRKKGWQISADEGLWHPNLAAASFSDES